MRFSHITNTLLRFIIVLIIVYILFNLGKSIFNNYEVNAKINRVKQTITDLEQQNQFLENQNLYYQTETFREIEARRKLGLKKEGETVVVVPENKDETSQSPSYSQEKQSQPAERILPNYLKWWNYMMGR